MKLRFPFLAVLAVALSWNGRAQAQTEKTISCCTGHRAFDNVGVSANIATTGFGVSVATPLHRAFSLRAGFQTAPFGYSYVYDDFDMLEVGHTSVRVPDLDLKAKLKMSSGHLLVDWVPFRHGRSSFFISAGFFLGSGKLVTVDGRFDMQALADAGIPADQVTDIPIEIGDAIIRPDAAGAVNAYLKVRSFKPYVGLGFGRAIPTRRVGFRFELGALFHGSPKIDSPNYHSTADDDELSDFNKLLDGFKIYPQLSFQVTVRLFKNGVLRCGSTE